MTDVPVSASNTLAPVYIKLSDLPPLADLPTAARKAISIWESTYKDLVDAEKERVAAADAFNSTYAERHAQALRAKAEGTPEIWPEKEAFDGIKGRIEVLHLLVKERHDDACRILGDHVDAERDKVDNKITPTAKAELQQAIDGLEAALTRYADIAGLRDWWNKVAEVYNPHARPNAAFAPNSALVMPYGLGGLSGMTRRTISEIVAPLRKIELAP